MRRTSSESIGNGGDDVANRRPVWRNRYHEGAKRARTTRDRGRDGQAAQAQGGLIVSVQRSRIAEAKACQDG